MPQTTYIIIKQTKYGIDGFWRKKVIFIVKRSRMSVFFILDSYFIFLFYCFCEKIQYIFINF